MFVIAVIVIITGCVLLKHFFLPGCFLIENQRDFTIDKNGDAWRTDYKKKLHKKKKHYLASTVIFFSQFLNVHTHNKKICTIIQTHS